MFDMCRHVKEGKEQKYGKRYSAGFDRRRKKGRRTKKRQRKKKR